MKNMEVVNNMATTKKRAIIPSGGNDKIMTPPEWADLIVSKFSLTPYDSVLEPCKGLGVFIDSLSKKGITADWCEIDEGVDFFDYKGHVGWIITNPPYSQFRSFLQKSMEVADNVVFLSLVNAFFFKARIRDMKQYNFGLKRIIYLDTPPAPWPQFGIQLGAVHIQKNYTGSCMIENLTTK